MQDSKLGFQKWAIAIYMMVTGLKGTSSMKLHRELGIRQGTAWHLMQRIREGFVNGAGVPLAGPVEVDETYVGGRRKNMHARKRRRLRGRGATEMVAVVGARDRATKTVVAQVVGGTDAKTLQGFVTTNTRGDSTVYTDEARAYLGLARKHHAVRHSVGEYVDGMAHVNGIESFWATLKRGYKGVYHQMSPQHLHRYVREFAGRHNIRDLDTVAQMSALARSMVGKRLRQWPDLAQDATVLFSERPDAAGCSQVVAVHRQAPKVWELESPIRPTANYFMSTPPSLAAMVVDGAVHPVPSSATTQEAAGPPDNAKPDRAAVQLVEEPAAGHDSVFALERRTCGRRRAREPLLPGTPGAGPPGAALGAVRRRCGGLQGPLRMARMAPRYDGRLASGRPSAARVGEAPRSQSHGHRRRLPPVREPEPRGFAPRGDRRLRALAAGLT